MTQINPKQMDQYLTVKEVIIDFSISRATLYRWIKSKTLNKYKFGGSTRIKKDELIGLITS